MTADQLRSLLRGLVYVAVVTVPVLFWRAVGNAFDLTKATLLVTLALFALVGLIWLAILEPRRIAPRSILITSGLFVAALLVATITSINPIGSIIGQPGRFTGVAVVIGCVVIMLSLIAAFGEKSLTTLGRVLTAVMAIVGIYAFLQHVGADPFVWVTSTFGRASFSTVGNPNTAAGVTAIALPFVLWMMLDGRLDRWWRLGAGAVAGLSVGALVAFASFQGPVAALVSVIYLLVWAAANGRTLGVWLIAVAAAVPLMVLPLLPRTSATAAFVIFVAYYVALVWLIPMLERRRAPAVLRERRWWVVGAVGLIAVVGAALFGPNVAGVVGDELADGLNERTAFYRAAVDSFAETPVTGDGFDTFGITFTQYRPEWHATRLEASRTSSVHSIWLAMFQSGGVLLGGTYVALMAAVLVWLGRGLRRDVLAGGGLLLAAGAAVVASMVQGLVSVEHVALYLLHFIAAGMVVAVAVETLPATTSNNAAAAGTRTPPPKSQRRRRAAQRRVPTVAVAASLVVALVVVAVVVMRPMRAELAERRANQAIGTQQIESAFEALDSAVGLMPTELQYWGARAALFQAVGNTEAAASDATELLSRSHGSVRALPAVQYLIDQAEAQIAAGDTADATDELLRARRWVELLQRNDPFAPRTNRTAADLLVNIATGFQQLDDREAATATLNGAILINPEVEIPDELQPLVP